ncbi:MAG TPA: PhnD/SsuA/transferrin family substrate-binding protein [Candidatus Xenobia bacterium]|jgi:phosphonate transport system substrate-binding protein
MVTAVSLLAPVADPFYRAVSEWLTRATALPVQLLETGPWEAREQALHGGHAHLAFMCGIQYARRAQTLRLLGVPVPDGPRYGGRPVYYTDVVVRADSSFSSFADLRGQSWAYNGLESFSGYCVVAAHLAQLGEVQGYFGRAMTSGAHAESLRLVLDGKVDAAPIDSTVLDMLTAADPTLCQALRVVERMGPSPHPPAVARADLDADQFAALQHALLNMHEDREGRKGLALGGFRRWLPGETQDYLEQLPLDALAAQTPLTP